MVRLILAGLAATVCAGAAVAADVPPPRWDISETCATVAQSDPCPRIESDTRRTLLDRWTALPSDIRITCSRDIGAGDQPSYRKLAACIDDLAFKAFDEQRQTRGAETNGVTAN